MLYYNTVRIPSSSHNATGEDEQGFFWPAGTEFRSLPERRQAFLRKRNYGMRNHVFLEQTGGEEVVIAVTPERFRTSFSTTKMNPRMKRRRFRRNPGMKWHTTAGGTGAYSDKHHGYTAHTNRGDYHIWPPSRRRGSYSLWFTSTTGWFKPGSNDGLWQDLGRFMSPQVAKKAANKHHASLQMSSYAYRAGGAYSYPPSIYGPRKNPRRHSRRGRRNPRYAGTYLGTITKDMLRRQHGAQLRLQTMIRSAIGRILPQDVGKQVYDVGGVIQVENNQQRDARRSRRR